LERAEQRLTEKSLTDFNNNAKVINSLFDKILILYADRPYTGEVSQRSKLRSMTSFLVARYINAVNVKIPQSKAERRIEMNKDLRAEIDMLKELTWCYVINNDSLLTQQMGQRKIIAGLFDIYSNAAESKKQWHIFPKSLQKELTKSGSNGPGRTRIVADLIASLTEAQAITMYHRFSGIALGSALTSVVQ
jgi:dGTPase